MPKISLWNPRKTNDYRFADKISSESMFIGGCGILLHKYLGVNGNDDIKEIEDVLFLENRSKNYDQDVIELRGIFSPIDNDYDLSQFGIFLSNDILSFEFHYNDMIEMVGRKLISGDVFEVPAQRDTNLDGIFVNSYYVVQDALYSSNGYSMTWHPHIWKVRAKKLDGSPEFKDIIEHAASKTTIGNEGNHTGIMPQGLIDIIDGYQDEEVKSSLDLYCKILGISSDVVREAENNIYFDPKFYNSGHFYITKNSDGYYIPEFYDGETGVPPNGFPLRGIGNTFPDNMNDGEYFLRVDYDPDRLFQKQGNRYIRVSDELRKTWTAYNRRLDTYIDNNNITVFNDGLVTPEKAALSTVMDPIDDISSNIKQSLEEANCEDRFIAKKIGNVGNKPRGWEDSDRNFITQEEAKEAFDKIPKKTPEEPINPEDSEDSE